MAGRPVLRKLRGDIEERGGIEYIATLVADGYTMSRIGKVFGVSRQLIYHWINEDERRREKFDAAREASADAMVEDALDELDTPLPPGAGSAEVNIRNSRANFRKWLAGVRNEKYRPESQKGDVNVQVSLGVQHLEALMQKGRAEVLEEVPNRTQPRSKQIGASSAGEANSVVEELI